MQNNHPFHFLISRIIIIFIILVSWNVRKSNFVFIINVDFIQMIHSQIYLPPSFHKFAATFFQILLTFQGSSNIIRINVCDIFRPRKFRSCIKKNTAQ